MLVSVCFSASTERLMQRPYVDTISFENCEFTVRYPDKDTVFELSDRLNHTLYHDRTDFNYMLVEFKTYFNHLRNSTIPPEKRDISHYTNLHISKESPEKQAAFDFIKKIANFHNHDINIFEVDDAEEYLQSYHTIFSQLEDEFHWQDCDYFIVPLKGGGIVTRLFPLDIKKIIDIECKRLPLQSENNDFALGMNINREYNDLYTNVEQVHEVIDSLDNKKISILEVCVATGMTTFGFLLDLYSRSVKNVKLRVICTAVSLQGFELVSKFATFLGYQVEFVTGKVIYTLGDHLKMDSDSLVYDDGQLVVKSPWDAYKKLYASRK